MCKVSGCAVHNLKRNKAKSMSFFWLENFRVFHSFKWAPETVVNVVNFSERLRLLSDKTSSINYLLKTKINLTLFSTSVQVCNARRKVEASRKL